MTYATVCDVPASWDRYAIFRERLASRIPSGLLLHLAGPTDEGFRVIDVWNSREDYERYSAGNPTEVETLAPATLRDLDVVTTIFGEGS